MLDAPSLGHAVLLPPLIIFRPVRHLDLWAKRKKEKGLQVPGLEDGQNGQAGRKRVERFATQNVKVAGSLVRTN